MGRWNERFILNSGWNEINFHDLNNRSLCLLNYYATLEFYILKRCLVVWLWPKNCKLTILKKYGLWNKDAVSEISAQKNPNSKMWVVNASKKLTLPAYILKRFLSLLGFRNRYKSHMIAEGNLRTCYYSSWSERGFLQRDRISYETMKM